MLMGRRATLHFLCAWLACCPAGCKRKQQLQSDEDLKAVVAEDRRLAQEEDALLARRGALQRERGSLRDKRAELLSRKMSLEESDTLGREEIEKEETKLARLEEALLKQELGLNRKLQSLLDEKSGVVDKLGKGGSGKDLLVARQTNAI
jgi:predicted  nucleic acid-binding Zn-ribbon protein